MSETSTDLRPASSHRPTPTTRHYLMCRPRHFDVRYSINPWMRPERPTSAGLAQQQWQTLHDLLLALGHRVDLLEPLPGLPDMVFAANGATVIDGKALVARFRHQDRTGESPAYLDWFTTAGYDTVTQAAWSNEGEGDYLLAGDMILAGTGFRSDQRSHVEVHALFDRPVIALDLIDPRYYHLDTALAVLSAEDVMYYPGAFSPSSQELLRRLYPDALIADPQDAAAFGLNAVSDGHNVILPESATGLAKQLLDRGYRPLGVDLSELLKAGGSAKCCALELRRPPAPTPSTGA